MVLIINDLAAANPWDDEDDIFVPSGMFESINIFDAGIPVKDFIKVMSDICKYTEKKF